MRQAKITIKVKSGTETLTTIEGRPVPMELLTVADLKKVIEVEQWLEKLTGYRYHINMEEPEVRFNRGSGAGSIEEWFPK
jgi:hypothetical protein